MRRVSGRRRSSSADSDGTPEKIRIGMFGRCGDDHVASRPLAKSKIDDRRNERMLLERLEAFVRGFGDRHREPMHFEKLDERPTHRQIVLDDEHEPRFFIHNGQ